MSKFSLAVLDIAGTTVVDNNFVAKSFLEAFTKNGINLTIEEINPLMGYKKTEAIKKILDDYLNNWDERLIETIHKEFVSNMINFYSHSPEIIPLPGVEEFLSYLKSKNIIVSLNSGFPRVIVDVILERLKWINHGIVDLSVASDEVAQGRPFPYMIEYLMEKSGIKSSREVIKVGDTKVDIQEGRMSNCGLVAAVTTGSFTRKELLRYSPDVIVDSIQELEKHISDD